MATPYQSQQWFELYALGVLGVLLYKDQWLTLSEDEVNPAFIYKP